MGRRMAIPLEIIQLIRNLNISYPAPKNNSYPDPHKEVKDRK